MTLKTRELVNNFKNYANILKHLLPASQKEKRKRLMKIIWGG